MKRSTRLFLTGTVQSLFFKQFIKEHADKKNIKGFLRKLEDGRVEIFLEGNQEDVDAMAEICKRGPHYSNIRDVEQKEEKFQYFKDFKIFNF